MYRIYPGTGRGSEQEKLTLYNYLITVTPNVSKEVEGCQKYINGDAM